MNRNKLLRIADFVVFFGFTAFFYYEYLCKNLPFSIYLIAIVGFAICSLVGYIRGILEE
jgi:hypothetical protein